MKKIWQKNNFEIDLSKWREVSCINGKSVTTNSLYYFCIVSGFIWLQNWYWTIVYLINVIYHNTTVGIVKISLFVFMTVMINVCYYPLLLLKKKITKMGYYANLFNFTWLCAYHYTDINACKTIDVLIYTIIIDFIIASNLLKISGLVVKNLIALELQEDIPRIIIETAVVVIAGILLYFIPSLIHTGF